MIVSLINPHDICYMAIRDCATTRLDSILVSKGEKELKKLDEAMEIPEGVTREEFFAKYCPPLPPNFEPQQDEPAAVSVRIDKRPFMRKAREQYTEEDWRMHRYAYCRLTEDVDRQLQVVLDAIKESGQEENTLVLFSSDHGDMDGAHRLEHKSLLYEESANIPFLAMWKGQIPCASVDEEHLVSNGLDLLPTVCDYAGTRGTADPRGKSLRPLFEGKNVKWRDHLGVESEFGNMVLSADGMKYIRYSAAGTEENLIDLNDDPFETSHVTSDPDYQARLVELRMVYDKDWFPSGN